MAGAVPVRLSLCCRGSNVTTCCWVFQHDARRGRPAQAAAGRLEQELLLLPLLLLSGGGRISIRVARSSREARRETAAGGTAGEGLAHRLMTATATSNSITSIVARTAVLVDEAQPRSTRAAAACMCASGRTAPAGVVGSGRRIVVAAAAIIVSIIAAAAPSAAAAVEGVLVRQRGRPAPLQDRSPQPVVAIAVGIGIAAVVVGGAGAACIVAVAHFGKEVGRGGGGGRAGADIPFHALRKDWFFLVGGRSAAGSKVRRREERKIGTLCGAARRWGKLNFLPHTHTLACSAAQMPNVVSAGSYEGVRSLGSKLQLLPPLSPRPTSLVRLGTLLLVSCRTREWREQQKKHSRWSR